VHQTEEAIDGFRRGSKSSWSALEILQIQRMSKLFDYDGQPMPGSALPSSAR